MRRRDILTAIADDRGDVQEELASEAIFVPDNAAASDALQTFLKYHQQLAYSSR